MMKIKYMIHPQWMTSEIDGEHHYITADQLVRLYKVDQQECVIFGLNLGNRHFNEKNIIHLYPRYDGDYCLPNQKHENFNIIEYTKRFISAHQRKR